MSEFVPSIEFFEGISEELGDVSLRRNRSTGVRTVLLTFKSLKSIERFRSYTSRFVNALRLTDEEGRLSLHPSSFVSAVLKATICSALSVNLRSIARTTGSDLCDLCTATPPPTVWCMAKQVTRRTINHENCSHRRNGICGQATG
jgi:photosystem II reaction center protein Psb28